MTKKEQERLKQFMYWLAEYKGWEHVKIMYLIVEYEAYLKAKL